MEKGWLKLILEQATADRETWPAWQRGLEIESRHQDQLAESGTNCQEDSDHKAAA